MSSSAEQAKTKGNAAFKTKDYDSAIDYYTQGIKLDQDNYLLPLNRAACYLQIQDYEKALKDGQKTIQLCSKQKHSDQQQKHLAKAYMRVGDASKGLGKISDAKIQYKTSYRLFNSLEIKKRLQDLSVDVSKISKPLAQKSSQIHKNMGHALMKSNTNSEDFHKQVKIRPFNANMDSTAVRSLVTEAYQSATPHNHKEWMQWYCQEIQNTGDLADISTRFEGPGSEFWVAEYNGRLIGCIGIVIGLDPNGGEIRHLAVSSGYRRRNIGRKLLATAELHARKQKCQELTAEVLEFMTAAMTLLKKQKFTLEKFSSGLGYYVKKL
eukprot:gb/GECH01000967.1/.p1 GENE.gb/GECH01000967.1/~~gb/GECH01000967.1/.p1  ORF type:complete len:323 (+),score=54.23 gb/GECH01000967.1/:1-969(+)